MNQKKPGEEKKIKISISIYESILDGVKEEMSPGQKLSPLIENLLVSWAYRVREGKKRLAVLEKKRPDITKDLSEEELKKFMDFVLEKHEIDWSQGGGNVKVSDGLGKGKKEEGPKK